MVKTNRNYFVLHMETQCLRHQLRAIEVVGQIGMVDTVILTVNLSHSKPYLEILK